MKRKYLANVITSWRIWAVSSKKQFPPVRQTWIPPVIQVAILLWGRKNQSGFWSWWRPGTSQISCRFQREFPFSFFPGGKDTVIDPVKGGKGQFGRRFLDKWWRLLGNLCDPKTESKFRWLKKEVLYHQYSALHSLRFFFLNREWSYSAKHDHLEHNPQQKATVGRGERKLLGDFGRFCWSEYPWWVKVEMEISLS